MAPELVMNAILMGCMLFLALLVIVAVIRSILGPGITDRLISVNMIGTMVIAAIAILSIFLKEDYLVDVCLVYAMVSFLTVVVLAKVYTGNYMKKKEICDEDDVVQSGLRRQEALEVSRRREKKKGKEEK
ncbi:MAG: sodium:proton antiporter [Lachnospiraceae bacterium]|nr:sodium:proton antiporter [Lachnospiraceae bacterium]